MKPADPIARLLDRLALLSLAAGIAAVPVLWWVPVRGGATRLAALAAPVLLWIGLLWLVRRRRSARWIIGLAPVALAIPFLLPGRGIDADRVRDGYVERMERLESTGYFWGGETARGIDCSGLPRKALRDSLFSEGIRGFNGAAIRLAFRHWWFDASAKALRDGYRGYATPLGVSGTVRGMDYSQLLPGDFVVTDDGVHVMCFLGGNRWIQADPGAGRVVIENGRTADNRWLEAPAGAFRWSVLEEGR